MSCAPKPQNGHTTYVLRCQHVQLAGHAPKKNAQTARGEAAKRATVLRMTRADLLGWSTGCRGGPLLSAGESLVELLRTVRIDTYIQYFSYSVKGV